MGVEDMAEGRSHRTTSNRLAKKFRTEYNDGPGVDIKADGITVEVETQDSVNDGKRQLQGHKGPVYIAGTNEEAVQRALEATKNTTIGVMDNRGNIRKRSTRTK